ncbi:MAG: DUF4857 domain-containing protein [Campylobacterales bacterium]|nr:DUF4857 domain-containing protein [Campylobacterales bacterium]
MKSNIHHYLRTFILISTVALLSIALPDMYKKFFGSKLNSIFVGYSPIDENFVYRESSFGKNSKTTYYSKTETFKKDEYIGKLPLMYYRYLINRDKFPEELSYLGEDPALIREYTQYFRFRANEINRKQIPLHTLFEANPKYGRLEQPKDMYRLTENGIQFVNLSTNQVDKEKTLLFTKALQEEGASFPIKRAFSNPNVRKSFDEGAFMVDGKNQVFHLKMIDDKPVVNNTSINMEDIKYIKVDENGRKEFYGALITEDSVHLITYENYKLIKLPLDKFDYKTSSLSFRVSPIHKFTSLTYYEGDKHHIDSTAMNLDYSVVQRDRVIRDRYSSEIYSNIITIIFPFILELSKGHDYHYSLKLKDISMISLGISLILGLLYIVLLRKNRRNPNYYKLNILLIIFGGIYGIITILTLGKILKNYDMDKEEL